jgi:CHAT domain-containing protein/uncharacterized protein HemY
MSHRFKSLTVTTLVISLICPVALTAHGLVVKYTLAQTATTSNSKAEADRLFQEGVQQYRLGKYPQALQTYEKVLEMRRKLGDKTGIGQTLNNIGEVYLGLELDEKALEVLQQASAIWRELKDKVKAGETLDNIGGAYLLQVQDDKALEILQQALAIRREVGDKTGEAKTLSRIGAVYDTNFKQYTKALETLNQALKIQEAAGDKLQTGLTLNRIATVYFDLKDYPRALEVAQKALSLNQEIKNRAREGEVLTRIGRIYIGQNKYDQALQLYQQVLLITRESGNRSQESQTIRLISSVYLLQNKIDTSLEFGQQALVLARENQLRRQEMRALYWLARVYVTRLDNSKVKENYTSVKSDATQILELSKATLTLARQLKISQSEADALKNIGRAYAELKEDQKAIEALQEAVSIARTRKDLDSEASVLTSLDSIYTEQGDNRKVLEVRLRLVEIYREQKDKLFEASNLIGLGDTYININEYQKAVEAYQQSIVAARQVEIGKQPAYSQDYALSLEYKALDGLSRSSTGFGQLDKAVDFAQQALKYTQTIRKPDLEANALLQLSFLYTNSIKDFNKAIAFSQQALTIARQIKAPQLEAKALDNLSYAYNKQGNQQKALEYTNQVLEIAKRLENPTLEFSALGKLSDIYENQGNYPKVLELAQQKLALVQKEKLGIFETSALTNLSKGYRLTGDTTKAVETAKQAITLAKQQNNPTYEAIALLDLSLAYKLRGEYDLGIATAQSALGLFRTKQYFGGEVAATAVISGIYDALGEYQKVIAVAEPALKLSQKINNRINSAELLSSLGSAYTSIGDYTKAKDFLEQSLKIAKELKNPSLELTALNRLGSYYREIKDYQKALSFSEESLKIAKSLENPPLLVSPQITIGSIYYELGNYNKAKEFYQQARITLEKLNNREDKGVVLLNLANISFAQGEPQKTVEFSQQALTIFQEVKSPRLEAFAYQILSTGYGELGNDAKAIESAQSFLTFSRKVQNPVFEKLALSNLASLHRKFGRKDEAISNYNAALAITGENAYIYAGLARVYQDKNDVAQAINFYQKSIGGLKQIRTNIQGLPPQLQTSFLQATIDFDKFKTSDIYRQLAVLLLKQGRVEESLQVKQLAGIQELREATNVVLSETEKKIIAQYGSLIAFEQKLEGCRKNKCSEFKQLQTVQDEISNQYNTKLNKLAIGLRNRFAEDNKGFFDPELSGKIREIVESQPGTVFISPIVYDNSIWLIWASEGGVRKAWEIKNVSEEELRQAVEDFRTSLARHTLVGKPIVPVNQVQQKGKKLYDWLIKPLEGELRQNKIKNLVFALDRQVRYVPMSALYDGEKYLVERYNVSVVPSAALVDMKEKLPPGIQNVSVLGLGLTNEVPGFDPLPNVQTELDGIVRKSTTDSKGIFPGKEFFNQAFDFDTLRNNLRGNQILHIATHGVFEPGSADASYIVLGTGKKLPIPEITNLSDLYYVHLVVLSACETAVGKKGENGVEINSISSKFLSQGTKAVIASLWSVNDESTSLLMENFYGNLAKSTSQKHVTKAEALHQAQLSLLYSGKNPQPNDLSHPYYWAPFILIGNGL